MTLGGKSTGGRRAARDRFLDLALPLLGAGGSLEAFLGFLGSAAAPPLDEELTGLLEHHGIAPSLCSALAGMGALSRCPAALGEWLRKVFRRESLENAALLGELRHLAGAMDARGVRPVLLKGASLFTTLYGHPGLRPMEDVDILVRPKDLPAAEELLKDFGYSLPRTLREETVRRHHFHLPFHHRGRGFRVELHWSLADDRSIPSEAVEELWERIEPMPGLPAWRLDGEAEFLYLALHARKHGYLNDVLAGDPSLTRVVYDRASGNRLVWLLDMHRLMRKGEGPGLAALAATAGRWRALPSLHSGTVLAQRLFGEVEGWSWPPGAAPPPCRGLRGLLLGRLARGIARGSSTALSLAHRLEAMDHRVHLRPARALDLFDGLGVTPVEAREWRRKHGPLGSALLHLGRAVSGLYGALRTALPWVAARARGGNPRS